MKFFWQAAVDCVVEVSATCYHKLRFIGECTWPEGRPLKDNRAVRETKKERVEAEPIDETASYAHHD